MDTPTTEYRTIEESREALVLYIQKHGRIPAPIICNTSQWGTERQMLLDLAWLGYLGKGHGVGGKWLIRATLPGRNLGTYRTHGVGGGRDTEIIRAIENDKVIRSHGLYMGGED